MVQAMLQRRAENLVWWGKEGCMWVPWCMPCWGDLAVLQQVLAVHARLLHWFDREGCQVGGLEAEITPSDQRTNNDGYTRYFSVVPTVNWLPETPKGAILCWNSDPNSWPLQKIPGEVRKVCFCMFLVPLSTILKFIFSKTYWFGR